MTTRMVSETKISRRDVMKAGATLAAGLAFGGGGLSLLTSCGQAGAAAAPTATTSAAPSAAAAKAQAQTPPEWPWPYQPLDPKAVAQKAYEGFYEAACMYGAFNAIISALREKVGYPYTTIPTQMARYGEGGVVGWATLCGTLNGSAAAINLVSKDYSKIVDELMGWYTTAKLPTFEPSQPKVKIQTTSVSGSPLCHVSVTEWCKASGAKSESPERAERCARLAASVAAHAVELLNDYAAGKFAATFSLPASISTCGACHLKGGTIENARGKMDCVQCHTPHQ